MYFAALNDLATADSNYAQPRRSGHGDWPPVPRGWIPMEMRHSASSVASTLEAPFSPRVLATDTERTITTHDMHKARQA